MVSVSNFIGHTSNMLNRIEAKEKSVEKLFGISTVKSKERGEKEKMNLVKRTPNKFCDIVNGGKICGTGYGL